MKTKLMTGLAAVVCTAGLNAGHAAEVRLKEAEDGGRRNHLLYVGVGFGPTQLKTSGDEREISGIDFTFDANASDLGGLAYVGYWITDHVGFEIGGRDYGAIDVPFEFSDPHDNTTGTGESEVSMGGTSLSLMLGFDPFENVQVVLRAGALMWTEDFKTRFDIPGEPAINRALELTGTGLTYGLGVSYRFTPGWQLEARFEQAAFDEDEVSLISVGLSYDFAGLWGH